MSTLVENVAKVVSAHAALKTAIAARGVAVPDGTKLSAMPALVDQIQTGGTEEPNMSRVSWYGDTSTSMTVPALVVVDVPMMEVLTSCFNNCSRLTTLNLPDGFGAAALRMDFCFYYCPRLTTLHLPDGCGAVATNIRYCFSDCSSLANLHLPDGFGAAGEDLGGCFLSCQSLANITGNPNFKVSVSFANCPNLTHDSIMVIINGLQTVTSSPTLTLGTANLSKITDEEKKVATDKGWTLA
nr:MAG TPA: leucine-rich repeat protein [Caudoviricetes sp.]